MPYLHKVLSDGAVPDNRKAAFFDLFKLEHCVDSGPYTSGVFLWLTGQPDYRKQASGDSAEFSTHDGRIYRRGTPLRATRSLVLQVSKATPPNPAMHPTGTVRS